MTKISEEIILAMERDVGSNPTLDICEPEDIEQALSAMSPATASNPYLKAKNVGPARGLLESNGDLVVPYYDRDGVAKSYQRINREDKWIAKGTSLANAFFVVGSNNNGRLPNLPPAGAIQICESIATGLSLRRLCLATLTVVTGGAANLANVVRIIKGWVNWRPRESNITDIYIMADDDHNPDCGTNAGRDAAIKAARECGLPDYCVFTPPFDHNTDAGLSNWNDYEIKYGASKTYDVILEMIKVKVALDNKARGESLNASDGGGMSQTAGSSITTRGPESDCEPSDKTPSVETQGLASAGEHVVQEKEPIKIEVKHISAKELLKKLDANSSSKASTARASSVTRSSRGRYNPLLARRYDPVNPYEAEAEFRQFLLEHVEPEDPCMQLISDGQTHRFAVAKGSGNKDGEYYLHVDGTPNGGVRDWRNSCGNSSCEWIKWKWDYRDHESLYTLYAKSEADKERARLKKQREAQRAEQQQANQQAHEEAAKDAQSYFQNLDGGPTDHGYLRLKQIPFVRGMAIKSNTNTLRVPLFNELGELRSYQTIFFDLDTKKFVKRYQEHGDRSCTFCAITPEGLGPLPSTAKTICLCEGLATGVSAYDAIKGEGGVMVCCMDCHSLEKVAPVARRKYPNAEIFIFADDDHNGKDNPGIKSAEAAARAITLPLSHVILPLFKDANDQGTDFNDFACKYGIESMIAMVREQIERASHHSTRELSFTERFIGGGNND